MNPRAAEIRKQMERLINQPHHSADQKAKAKLIMDLNYHVFVADEFDKAVPIFGAPYIQHNPGIADGVDGLRVWAKERASEGAKLEFLRLMVDGEHVFVHMKVTNRFPGDVRGLAVADLFRIENMRVVEHWDIWQEVPEKALNDNTMF